MEIKDSEKDRISPFNLLFENSAADNDEVRFRKFDPLPDTEVLPPSKKKNAIRKSLLGDTKSGQDKKSRGTIFVSESSDEDQKRDKCPCGAATNLKIRTGAETGLWNYWGVYYCSSRFGRHAEINSQYFALAALFVISQGSMLNLIYYMNLHGGCAFLVVLTLIYISLGYPMFLFETMMGQYSSRKPILMLRYMYLHSVVLFLGIGPALYLRTIVKAVNALGTFVYCAYLAFGLFFCKPTDNVLIYRFLEAERRNRQFNLLVSNVSTEEAGTLEHHLYEGWWLIVFTIALFCLVAQTLKLHGFVSNIVVRVLLLAMGGYLLVGVARISDASAKSIVYIPLMDILKPDWSNLVKGQAWLDAIIFVTQSMELGTLVHPYLGSKSFFHYRSYRDGIYLTLLALIWNVATSIAALAWLGYVGVNKKQMSTATEHLFGHYGLIIVFMLKHLQAEMTQMVQGDVLFFNAFFYSIVGAAALWALVVYIIIIIDCSYPESGQWLLKLVITVVIVLFFGMCVPTFVIQDEGLRRLIFVNFYVHKSWSVFFIVGCYFGAVGFGHDMGKFVHDFLNIIHIQGYQSKQHSYIVPRTLRYFVLTFLGIGMICYIFTRPYPHEGQTDWGGSGRYLGIAFSCVPLLVIVSVAIYYRARQGEKTLRPHRDWFKNKHHKSVCFADFENFQGIPALQDLYDPERFESAI